MPIHRLTLPLPLVALLLTATPAFAGLLDAVAEPSDAGSRCGLGPDVAAQGC